MQRRTASVLLFGTLLAAQVATAAPKQDTATRQAQLRTAAVKAAAAAQTSLAPVALSAIFAAVAADLHAVSYPNGMDMIDAPNTEVVIARKNADGTRERACVNTEAAAHQFMEPQQKTATPSTGQEQ